MTKKLILTMTLLAAVATIFVACKKDDPTYSVQVTAAQGGTIEGQSGEYKEGETIVFKAIPADGYYFTQWSDGDTDNPRTITLLTSDISLTAIFIGVSATATEGGTVETQKKDQSFVFTAIPAMDYCFSQWSDGNIDNPREITVGKDDISLTAEFAEPTIATVDLGLPSGNLWATCNVGAANPWNYGNYYAWGETQTKDNYHWDTYKYCNGDYNKLTKYNVKADYGTVDNKTTLESSDDVATAVYGAAYSIPTIADWKELAKECYWVWTYDYNNRGVSGYVVYRAKADADKGAIVYEGDTPLASYSMSDAHIFLPAAGCYRDNSRLIYVGSEGFYWSSSLCEDYPGTARNYYFFNGVYWETDSRDEGLSVRPVRHP
ncbi:MAG: hypothetical protein IKZ99_12825 [Salinivirgaceae bacterium]|nr:hypothetical protein [Salinivirgaceae bacterium]